MFDNGGLINIIYSWYSVSGIRAGCAVILGAGDVMEHEQRCTYTEISPASRIQAHSGGSDGGR